MTKNSPKLKKYDPTLDLLKLIEAVDDQVPDEQYIQNCVNQLIKAFFQTPKAQPALDNPSPPIDIITAKNFVQKYERYFKCHYKNKKSAINAIHRFLGHNKNRPYKGYKDKIRINDSGQTQTCFSEQEMLDHLGL